MKIKARPEDFVVSERSCFVVTSNPDTYRVYRLVKRQWDTFDLIDFLSRRFHIPGADISCGGIKDRYGDTTQLVSIKNRPGLAARLEEKNFSLIQEGYAPEKIRAQDIAGNFFTIVLRDIPYYQLKPIQKNCLAVETWGFPNYYDEQRFGSARAGQGFMGKALFLGKMQEALRIYLSPSSHDRREEKALKKQAIANWGKWEKINTDVPPKYRRIIACLTRPQARFAFTKAVNEIDRNLLVLALHGYQSFLFNLLVCEYLLQRQGELGTLHQFAFKYHPLYFYDELLPEEMRLMMLPVPGHDTHTDDPLVQRALTTILERENISLADLKVKKLPGKAVRGIDRSLIVLPTEFTQSEPLADDLYPGRYKMTLSFFLPRGSYATMLVKRVSLGTR